MIRYTMKMLLVALLASFALSSVAEAAPKKAVRHRAKHSSRVTTGTTGTTTTLKKPTTKKKRAASSAKKRSVRTAAKRKPTTKPR